AIRMGDVAKRRTVPECRGRRRDPLCRSMMPGEADNRRPARQAHRTLPLFSLQPYSRNAECTKSMTHFREPRRMARTNPTDRLVELRKHARNIIRILKRTYPQAECALRHENAFQ